MRTSCFLVTLAAAPFLASPAPLGAQAPEPHGKSAKARRGPFRAVFEAEGAFVPAHFTELSFSPQAYEGELRVAEVAPHGSRVRQGDVVLKLEDEKARDALRAAEWAQRTAERTLADAKVRYGEHEADMQRDVARAERELALADQALKGYLEVHRPLEKDEHELGHRSYKHSIDDQEDELAQLGKMYKEDQLTEETEEIVLKRANRNLEETKKRLDLFLRRHDFSEKFHEPAERERLENAPKDKRKALTDLRRARESGRELGKIELERLEHEAGAARRRLERLRADLERMAIRAPHDGVVIHGALEEKVAVSVLKRHQAIQAHQPIVTVADPGALKVRFNLKEKDRYRLSAGMGAAIVPEAIPDRRLAGSVEPVSGFPLPDNTWNAHVLFAHEDERLLPLLKAKVVVVLHDGMDALTVPLGAVFRRGDRSVCYVKGHAPFGVIARTVVTGPDNGKDVLIREGLSEGDEVLLEEPAAP
ncbi:MAG: HlyD family efflux transporter periplasmic adaptor subunit [Planctomycetes bacterium]|nr:HlyD family efflux transporter periplasmic adaptor subunit [Planctomycetota bacterium]